MTRHLPDRHPTIGAAELRRALAARRISQADLARRSGFNSRFISEVARGRRNLGLDTSLALSEILDWPRIHELNLARRTVVCAEAVCSRTFIRTSRNPQRFCSDQCKDRSGARTLRANAKVRTADALRRATEERDTLRAAVAAMCWGCEPEGVCRTGDCRLREASPLPFIPLSSVSRRVA